MSYRGTVVVAQLIERLFAISVTSKNSPNVYKSCPKMISIEILKILTPLQKMPKNVGDLGKINGFQRL